VQHDDVIHGDGVGVDQTARRVPEDRDVVGYEARLVAEPADVLILRQFGQGDLLR